MPALLGLLLSRPNGQQNARWAQLRCLQEEGCRWARQPGLTAEKKRVAASGERNEHRRVASPRPGWRRRARPSGPQLTGWTTTGLLSQTLPSRGESISFLSPARAAGAPTFCDATESRQRSQPRGLSPPWLTPAVFWPALSESSARRPSPRAAPAPGFRHRANGVLHAVGSFGYIWSSTETGDDAHVLTFYPGEIYPQISGSRAVGFPLRCLQE